jgi:hypothetical protein
LWSKIPTARCPLRAPTSSGCGGSPRGQAKRWLHEWERLLDGPVDELLANLTSRSPKGRELRQNSPFSGLLSEEERHQTLAAWRSHERGTQK